jgi:hypothetical protein
MVAEQWWQNNGGRTMVAGRWWQDDEEKDFDLQSLLLSFCPHRSAISSPLRTLFFAVRVHSAPETLSR